MSKDEFAGSRILLVEDEESLAVGLEYNLTSDGYLVTLAADGKQAIDRFRGGRKDAGERSTIADFDANGEEQSQRPVERTWDWCG